MKYCNNCGEKVILEIPKGDNRERYCCPNCEAIHYQNPNVVVGTLPVKEDKVLLCKRAIKPRYGLWTLPAGFLEMEETLEQGALRETLEETNTKVKMKNLYAIYNIPQIGQVYILYLAEVMQNNFGPTSESLEVKFFKKEEILWEELAFPFVKNALDHYFNDLKNGKFSLKIEIIERPKSPRN